MRRTLFALVVLLTFGSTFVLYAVDEEKDGGQIARASFNERGEVVLPKGYRGWIHVGTRIQTDGVNIIDLKEIEKPEILNAYVEPSAFAHFKQTGTWPDGAQLVKEFTTVLVGENYDPRSMTSDSSTGRAVFEDDYTGLGVMVKDRSRFPKENGYWGYFGFAHHAKPYPASMKVAPTAQCAQCHNRLAADQDYVFSSFHVVLRSTLAERKQQNRK